MSPAPAAQAAPTATGTTAAGNVRGRAPATQSASDVDGAGFGSFGISAHDGPMSELWQLGALELAEKIRNGRHHQPRGTRGPSRPGRRRQPPSQRDRAATRRRGAGRRRRGRSRGRRTDRRLGSLHGVPCTVKENIDLAGTPTTQGVPALADAVATIDAPTVERMRAAGAIPFARTNLPDLGLARPHRLDAPRADPQPVEPERHRRRIERRRGVGDRVRA